MFCIKLGSFRMSGHWINSLLSNFLLFRNHNTFHSCKNINGEVSCCWLFCNKVKYVEGNSYGLIWGTTSTLHGGTEPNHENSQNSQSLGWDLKPQPLNMKQDCYPLNCSIWSNECSKCINNQNKEVEKHKSRMVSSGMMLIQSFMKISWVVQKLQRVADTHVYDRP
jgi:hypothetical protein